MSRSKICSSSCRIFGIIYHHVPLGQPKHKQGYQGDCQSYLKKTVSKKASCNFGIEKDNLTIIVPH